MLGQGQGCQRSLKASSKEEQCTILWTNIWNSSIYL